MKKNAFTNFINDFKTWIEEVKKSDKKIKMIIPNMLTASRLLSPLFILPATLIGNFPLATAFATIFAITDAFDGFLARKWKTTSEFGKNLDPITDKFFILGIIIPFLNNSLMMITLILEGIIAGVNLKSAFKNNKPKSTYLGKSKTVLLSLLITLSYLFKLLEIPLDKLIIIALSTNIIQTITAIDYINIDRTKEIKKQNKSLILEETINNENQNNEKLTKIQQELIEYRHIKDFLMQKEKIEKQKKKHFNL